MKVIYFYHIGKCGGTSISNLFKELAGETNNEYYDFNVPMNNFNYFTQLKNDFKLSLFFKRINVQKCDIKFVHHHHGYKGISEIYDEIRKAKEKVYKAGHEFYLFTIIREPISLIKSKVNYNNKINEVKIDFEEFCNNEFKQNHLCGYMLLNYKSWKTKQLLNEQLLLKHVELFDQIFLLEEVQQLYDWLEEILGFPAGKIRKDNVNQHKILPTDEEIERLRRLNYWDYYLYNYVKNNKAYGVCK